MKSTKNRQNPDASSAAPKEQNSQKTLSTSIRDHRSVAQILEILEQDNAISAWLGSDEKRDPELFVLLADKLSQPDRDALAEVAHVVISKKDNLAARISELEKENQHLRSLSLTDGLTGLYNYRFFAKQLEIEMARTRRTGQPCSLIMIDLDDFKRLNDTKGHDEGNKYLVTVSRVILDKLRPTDILCRYGGDEFAVIMPATYLFDATVIARRLRNAINRIPPRLDIPFSASLGLAEYDPASGQEMGVFVNAADKALYRAKKGGKNKICHEGRLPKMGKAASVTQDEKAALLSKKRLRKDSSSNG
jgi:diguanylate cyclase (GGDEF)-like protein